LQGTYEGKAVLYGKSNPELEFGCVAFAFVIEAKQVTDSFNKLLHFETIKQVADSFNKLLHFESVGKVPNKSIL
jgi:hypothetical protein